MLPAELNERFFMAVLFWCAAHSDTTHYAADLSNVGSWEYNSGLGYPEMTSWAIGGYAMPSSTDDLLPYGAADVTNFFNQNYLNPDGIKQVNGQCIWPLTTADLEAVATDTSMIGLLAFDTTVRKVKRFTGSSWVGLW